MKAVVVEQTGGPEVMGLAEVDLPEPTRDLFEIVGSGSIGVRVGQRYELAAVQQAHRDLEAGKTTGSTVLLL